MTKRLIFISIVLLLIISCSQNKTDLDTSNHKFDSLLTEIENTDDLRKSKLLLQEAEKNIDLKNDTNSSVKLFKVANRYFNKNLVNDYKRIVFKANSNARRHKDTASIAYSYQYLGDYYYNTVYPDSSLYYYMQAEKYYKLMDNYAMLQECYLAMSRIKTKVNDLVGSELLLTQALSLNTSNSKIKILYEAHNVLGFISNEQQDYENAIKSHLKALEIAEKNEVSYYPFAIETSLNNIGNVYQNLNDHKSAIDYFNRALNSGNLRVSHPELYATLLGNLAYSLYKLGHTYKPEQLLYESIAINDSLENVSSSIFERIKLSEIYKENQHQKAYELANTAYQLSTNTSNPYDKLIALKNLIRNFPEESKNLNSDYVSYSDSLQQNERKIKDRFARIQFETEEIERQKDSLQIQNRNLMLFFFVTIMMVILLFVIRTQRAKNRELLLVQAQQKANEEIYTLMISQQNKLEEGRIKEKKRIAQELHDGVLSRLFGARLNLDSLNRMEGPDAVQNRMNHLQELRNIEQDIREISHDLNREKFILINNFMAILNNLFEEQAASFEPELVTHIDEKIEWDLVSNTVKINSYRIIQESLQNINKYANATKVEVRMKQVKNSLHLTITDNGQGFDTDKKSKGIGLQNITSRTHECNGNLSIKSSPGKGTSIEIRMPLVEEEPKNITTEEEI